MAFRDLAEILIVFENRPLEKSCIIEGMRAYQKEATGRKFAKAKESKNIRKQVLVDLHFR